jgi:hypothetical protein
MIKMLALNNADTYAAILTHSQVSMPPTQEDYDDTKRLFRGFGLKMLNIPEFETLSKLLSWRKGVINNFLDNWTGSLKCPKHDYIGSDVADRGKNETVIKPTERKSKPLKSETTKTKGTVKITVKNFTPYYERIITAKNIIQIKETIAAELKMSYWDLSMLYSEYKQKKGAVDRVTQQKNAR